MNLALGLLFVLFVGVAIYSWVSSFGTRDGVWFMVGCFAAVLAVCTGIFLFVPPVASGV